MSYADRKGEQQNDTVQLSLHAAVANAMHKTAQPAWWGWGAERLLEWSCTAVFCFAKSYGYV